ncbi:MAG: response regulator [Desulfobulbus sp.]|nr:response regulator [Desulfobulbus sp.]
MALERLGYTITTFTSADEAIAAFRSQPEQFDAVITDLTMPGTTGIDVARELLLLRPNLPIILCTGYSNLIDEAQVQAMGVKAFAMKPLTKRELAVLLHKALADQRKSSIKPRNISTR